MTIEGVSGNDSGKVIVEYNKNSFGEKISEGFYSIKSSSEITDTKKIGSTSMISILEQILSSSKIGENSSDYFYTNERSIIYRDDRLVYFCIYGKNGLCAGDGNKWQVELTKDCDCTDYSVNRSDGSTRFTERGIVCKSAVPPVCKAKEYMEMNFNESGVSVKIYRGAQVEKL